MSAQRELFRDRVHSLIQQVQNWVEANEWVTKPYPKRMRDVDNQVFEIPSLFLQKGPTRVLLDPIAYDVPGSEGVVDLYLMPTYDDMASLYFKNGEWTIHYPSSADSAAAIPPAEWETLALNETTINQVLDSIVAHAAPSF